jgi:hypothetical protein
MNIRCMGGRTDGPALAHDLIQTFLIAKLIQAPHRPQWLEKVAVLEALPGKREGLAHDLTCKARVRD